MGKPVCSLDGCTEPSKARGFCKSHWARVRFRERRLAEGRKPLKENPRPEELLVRYWTPAEDALILAEIAKGLGKADWLPVALQLGRTRQACRTRATFLRKRDRLADGSPAEHVGIAEVVTETS